MSIHLVAWSSAPAAAGVLTELTPIGDATVTVVGNAIRVPTPYPRLGAFYAIGSNLTRCRIVVPSLLRLAYFEARPIERATTPNDIPALLDHFDAPLTLVPTEPLTIQATTDLAASRVTALGFFTDGPASAITGELIRVRATGATPLVAFTWTAVPLVMDSVLPAGRYQIIGLRPESVGILAARIVIPGTLTRPGVLGRVLAQQPSVRRFMAGQLGSLGEFIHDAPPTIEVLSVSADAAQTFALDLVKIA